MHIHGGPTEVTHGPSTARRSEPLIPCTVQGSAVAGAQSTFAKSPNECTWDGQRLNWQWPHTYSSAHCQFKVLAPISGAGTAIWESVDWQVARMGIRTWQWLIYWDTRTPKEGLGIFPWHLRLPQICSSWLFWFYYLIRETLPHMPHIDCHCFMGFFLRVHPSLHILALADLPFPSLQGAPAPLNPVSVIKSQHKSLASSSI